MGKNGKNERKSGRKNDEILFFYLPFLIHMGLTDAHFIWQTDTFDNGNLVEFLFNDDFSVCFSALVSNGLRVIAICIMSAQHV